VLKFCQVCWASVSSSFSTSEQLEESGRAHFLGVNQSKAIVRRDNDERSDEMQFSELQCVFASALISALTDEANV
jgi:hypothetical protein